MIDMRAIKRPIVLMMENRSFDHYLGAVPLDGRPTSTVPRTRCPRSRISSGTT